MKKLKSMDIIKIIFGTMIVAFALSNIHARYKIAEGGQLGIELLFYHSFAITPALSSLIIDCIIFAISFFVLGKKHFSNAVFGTITYSLFYYVFQNIPYILPDLSNNLLLATFLGGILIGIGCGIVVKYNGACGGDDSLALMLSKITKLNISICYFFVDVIIILLSLTYLKGSHILYSLLTAATSSFIIGLIYNKKRCLF